MAKLGDKRRTSLIKSLTSAETCMVYFIMNSRLKVKFTKGPHLGKNFPYNTRLASSLFIVLLPFRGFKWKKKFEG